MVDFVRCLLYCSSAAILVYTVLYWVMGRSLCENSLQDLDQGLRDGKLFPLFSFSTTTTR